MKGAIDGVKLGNLTGLLDKIQPAVEARALHGLEAATPASTDVARRNVLHSMAEIRARSPYLAHYARRGEASSSSAACTTSRPGRSRFLEQ